MCPSISKCTQFANSFDYECRNFWIKNFLKNCLNLKNVQKTFRLLSQSLLYTDDGSARCCWTVLNKISEYTGDSSAVRKYDVSIWKKTENQNFSRRAFWEKLFFGFLVKFRYVTSTLYAIKSDVAGTKIIFRLLTKNILCIFFRRIECCVCLGP